MVKNNPAILAGVAAVSLVVGGLVGYKYAQEKLIKKFDLVLEEQIEAAAPSGQAPRIIESAPGVDFTQSGLYDFNFNARGFNSSLNRRILTLVDGRDPSVPFLGAQEWAALSFPMD